VRALVVAALLLASLRVEAEERRQVRSLQITILSTMLAEINGIGEWGFAALVEADGRRILFDTGRYPDTVLRNARDLGIDLSDVRDVVLSHNHGDHTGGLIPLRTELSRRNPDAMSRVYVTSPIFWARSSYGPDGATPSVLETKMKGLGGRFVVHDEPFELAPGVWLTGVVPRPHDERNYPQGVTVTKPDGSKVPDNIPEDLSMVIETAKGLVVLVGCGHAGVVNTIDHARRMGGSKPVIALIGGLHLYALDDKRLDWTANALRERTVGAFIGAHCTGVEATWRIRSALGLPRDAAVVGAVGASYSLDRGIDPGPAKLAR
jgi:7,8-dihydropterin-6-yl-methyl-4-(beta-D-ribofuranosyl)aminobenzene 5'-phosphate synthase